MTERTVLSTVALEAWGRKWPVGTAFTAFMDRGTAVEARAPNGDRVTLVRFQYQEVPLTLEALL